MSHCICAGCGGVFSKSSVYTVFPNVDGSGKRRYCRACWPSHMAEAMQPRKEPTKGEVSYSYDSENNIITRTFVATTT